MSRIVVVGHGMAGARFVQELRARDPERDHEIVVLSAENEVAYNRILLSSVLAGALTPAEVEMVPSAWYAAEDVDLRTGVEVPRINRANRWVHTTQGDTIEYDHLVLATGSRPWVPPVDGLTAAAEPPMSSGTADAAAAGVSAAEPPMSSGTADAAAVGVPADDGRLADGVAVFRTLDDCRAIMRRLESPLHPVRRAVVLGGGLLGLEAARGLAGRGVEVTVVHPVDRLMERQLDGDAARVLARTIAGLDVQVRLNRQAVAWHTPAGDATSAGDPAPPWAVELDDGTRVAADLVVVACGVRANTALAVQAGLEVEHGVVVDERLTSVTDPHIHAIGECSQYDSQVYGLVAPAWEQAAVLADVLTGADARYGGSRVVTRLKAAGVELATMGDADLDGSAGDDDGLEVVSFADPARGTYQKIVIRDDRITGAIMLGDTETVGTVTQLYDRDAPVPRDRRALIFPGVLDAGVAADVTALPDDAVVCRCNSVSCGEIRSACADGARSAGDVAVATRATTGCGSCSRDVEALVQRACRTAESLEVAL
jgi:assimilatory nitrate reductase electron transfer subunit